MQGDFFRQRCIYSPSESDQKELVKEENDFFLQAGNQIMQPSI